MRLIATLTALALLAGCEISDEDRCPGEMIYLAENMVCICPTGTVFDPASEACEDVEDVEDSSGDTDIDAGADGGNTSGFGEDCIESADCEEFEAVDYCVVNPLSSEGYCSLENCESGDCPGGWQCCDCLSFLGWVACLDDEYAATVSSMGCTCAP